MVWHWIFSAHLRKILGRIVDNRYWSITGGLRYIITAPEGISLDHGSISDLSELEPFHSDFDLTSVIPAYSSVSSTTDNESDPYIVERIEAKRFNSHRIQYEYNVEWLGYSSTENSWELPSNIPSSMLDAYEQSILNTNQEDKVCEIAQQEKL